MNRQTDSVGQRDPTHQVTHFAERTAFLNFAIWCQKSRTFVWGGCVSNETGVELSQFSGFAEPKKLFKRKGRGEATEACEVPQPLVTPY